jgi:hypothetical protein
MTDNERASAGPKMGGGIVAPISRVNLALPFSKITIQEPRRELAELSAIVAELVAFVESSSPGEAITGLRQRAEALAARAG